MAVNKEVLFPEAHERVRAAQFLYPEGQTSLSDPKLGGMKSRFSSPSFAEKIHTARDAGG